MRVTLSRRPLTNERHISIRFLYNLNDSPTHSYTNSMNSNGRFIPAPILLQGTRRVEEFRRSTVLSYLKKNAAQLSLAAALFTVTLLYASFSPLLPS